MTASPERRRNWTIAAALSGVLVLVAAPLLAYLGWNVLQDSKAGTQVDVLDEIAFPSTPTAMMAIVDQDNLITSLAVMVLSPRVDDQTPARGGTLVIVPTNSTTAQTADDTQLPISDSLINGGEEGLRADVESLMRVTLNQYVVLDETAAATLLQPLGDIPVSLPDDVVNGSPDGSTTTLFVAGDTELTPTDAAAVLTARVSTETVTKRLPTVRAVWNGVAEKVGSGFQPETATSAAPADFNDFIAHLLAGPVQVFSDLAAVPLTGANNPNGLDLGRLDVASVVLLMSGLAPSAMIAPNATVSFRIENGVTQADIDAAGLIGVTPVDVTRNLVQRILFLNGNVISVSPQIFTPEDKVVPDITTLYTTGNYEATQLETFTNALGEVSFVEPSFQFPLVDVVIVVGTSYLADMADKAAVTGTTDATDAADDTTNDSTRDTPAGSSEATTETDATVNS